MVFNNKQYNTRHSGRYNTSGQFVSAGASQQQGSQSQFQQQPSQQFAQQPPLPQRQSAGNPNQSAGNLKQVAGNLNSGQGSHPQGSNPPPPQQPQLQAGRRDTADSLHEKYEHQKHGDHPMHEHHKHGDQSLREHKKQKHGKLLLPKRLSISLTSGLPAWEPVNPPPPPPPPPPPSPPPSPPPPELEVPDVEMKPDPDAEMTEDGASRPPWMKSKLPGVKKLSKKEKRRRQNEHLRRIITPKNALMVLNEMMLHEQLTNQFKVEPAEAPQQYYNSQKTSFCADLTLDGVTYKGYGENKLMARNAAAEQAIRDLIIKRMNKAVSLDLTSDPAENPLENLQDDDPLPMIQLASYALHKLFSEWEYEGHKVPQLRPPTSSTSELDGELAAVSSRARSTAKKPAKELPSNAGAMHPCMLLTYMRPHLEYRELAAEGDRPQNMLFTMGVDVDGATYIGKASNKKEARKAAAKSACQALFNVKFDEVATANAPVVAAAV